MSFFNSHNIFNPIGLVRGIGQAAHDVFAPQPMSLAPMPPQYSAPPEQAPQPMFSPEEQAWNRMYADAMQNPDTINAPPVDPRAAQSLSAAQFEKPGLQFINNFAGSMDAPSAPPDQTAQMSGQAAPPAQLPPFAGLNGLAPGAAPQIPPPQGQAPYVGGSGNPTLAPFQRPVPTPQDISDQMRQMYMNQLVNSNFQADANLNYMQNDLMRRSKRDQSDDFFGSVLAPIAGGMAKNVGAANQMADRWMGQAQDRRGERMNIVNSLIGRQNRAQEYLQATDPTVIKNQVALWKAQTDANRAMYGHLDKQADQEIKKTANEQINNYRQGMLQQGQQRIEEAVRQGVIKRDLADSLIKKNEEWIDSEIQKGQQNQQKIDNQSTQYGQTLEEKKREADQREAGLNSRTDKTITAQDSRLDKTIHSREVLQSNREEAINQRTANKAGKDGKPMMSKAFRDLMQVPPQYRNNFLKAVAAFHALSPAEQKANLQSFIDHFHVDPMSVKP